MSLLNHSLMLVNYGKCKAKVFGLFFCFVRNIIHSGALKHLTSWVYKISCTCQIILKPDVENEHVEGPLCLDGGRLWRSMVHWSRGLLCAGRRVLGGQKMLICSSPKWKFREQNDKNSRAVGMMELTYWVGPPGGIIFLSIILTRKIDATQQW